MDSTLRFSDRVSDYVRYRPGYPAEILTLLSEQCGFTPRSLVADIGSGTGKLTELFLSHGNTVYAVEPNGEMRRAAEGLLGDRAGFRSVEGRAESTGLPDSSVDLVAAGQAFHWFDRDASGVEFRRILRRGGHVVLVWNERDESNSPFLKEYDAFLTTYSIDYSEVSQRNVIGADVLGRFFGGLFGERSFSHIQSVDFEGLLGRYLSASYALTRSHPLFPEAEERLRAIFETHVHDGAIDFPYVTRVYFGRLDRSRHSSAR